MSRTKLTINGSVCIEGDFEIVDKAGNNYDLNGREIVSICDAVIANKPICNGSHNGHFEHDLLLLLYPRKK